MRESICLLCLLIWASCCFAQLPEEEEAIRKILSTQQKAWNEGDIHGFMEGYWRSDSLAFIGSRGITYGWQATLENYKKSYPDKQTMGTLTFDVLRVEILSAESAFVVGKWHLKRKKDEPQGYFTLLWKKVNDSWVIVTDHSS